MPKDSGSTQELVAIEEIKEDVVILKNGSLRQIIMVGGINIALKSEMEQNIVTQAYQSFLNGLDFNIQIVVHSRKVNIEKYLETISPVKSAISSPLLENQTEEYKEFIRGFVAKNAIMEKTFLVAVPFASVSIPGAKSVAKTFSLPFWKKSGKEEVVEAKEEKDRLFREDLSQLRQRVVQVADGLRSIGLEAVILNTAELIQLFYNFYNPETAEKKEVALPSK